MLSNYICLNKYYMKLYDNQENNKALLTLLFTLPFQFSVSYFYVCLIVSHYVYLIETIWF